MRGKFHELYWRATARSFSGLNHEEKRLNGNERIALGNTRLSVSRLCFGTSALGDMPDTYNYVADEERALSTIRAIFKSPVNFLDTSRIYGHGRSEQRIGRVIQELGGLPDDFVISTKIDRNWETNFADSQRSQKSWRNLPQRNCTENQSKNPKLKKSEPLNSPQSANETLKLFP